jgi:hypothetical protein
VEAEDVVGKSGNSITNLGDENTVRKFSEQHTCREPPAQEAA